jgi:GTPase SAR1 family protein
LRTEYPGKIASFPEGGSPACSGAIIDEGRSFLVGHTDGQLVLWNAETGEGKLIGKLNSEIGSIAVSSSRDIAVGCHSGLLVVFNLQAPLNQRVLQEATSSVFSRVWRVAWLNAFSLISTSTYGSMTLWSRDNSGEWNSAKLEGHSHSVFGLDVSEARVATGDYGGNVLVFKVEAGAAVPIASISSTRVQNLSMGRDGSFATIPRYGSLKFFEFDSGKNNWNPPIDIATATSEGNCVHITADGESVLAGTGAELIQFDVKSQLVQYIPIQAVVGIFSTAESVYALTTNGITKFDRSPAEAPLPLIRYNYAKVSLVGHTEVGKTTFFRRLLGGEAGGAKSTIGREVKFWVPDPAPVPQRRIAVYDHGGQETVLGTFIPLLSDSDVVLVFFSQRDVHSWERAEQIIEELRDVVQKDCKILLVRTHIDEADEVREIRVKRLMERVPNLEGPYRVDSTSGEGVEGLKRALLGSISWERARTVFESKTKSAVDSAVEEFRKAGASVVSLSQIREKVEQVMGSYVSPGHLRYLLQNLTVEGIIEFYPQVIESVIFNDDNYNKLKSEIPFFVAEQDGIVKLEQLMTRFSPKDYVEILDQVYTQYGVSVRNDGLRIFPGVLPDGAFVPPKDYLELLKTPVKKGSLKAPLRRIAMGPVFAAMSTLRLQCVGATLVSGLFAWERNACIYYSISRTDDPLKGKYLAFEYVIAGSKEEFCERLEREFSAIVRQLYGEFRENEPT